MIWCIFNQTAAITGEQQTDCTLLNAGFKELKKIEIQSLFTLLKMSTKDPTGIWFPLVFDDLSTRGVKWLPVSHPLPLLSGTWWILSPLSGCVFALCACKSYL